MMRSMAQPVRTNRYRYSYVEYLAYERASAERHEYIDGEILAMAGGSPRHNVIALRVGAAMDRDRRTGCLAYSSDQKIRILSNGRTRHADASMTCGPIERDPADATGQTITNPAVVVEVLSPSTEEVDRGEKWQDYQSIPSLQECVLISQHEPRVEVYRRSPGGTWEYSDTTVGAVRLSTGALVELDALYADLPD
jgi:Uma2 family endonuclease